MVMILEQDIPSDKLIYYRRNLIEAVDKPGYQYGVEKYGARKYGPAPSQLYNNRYGDNVYHGRPYGANLYPWLSRTTTPQQMQFARKRMPHIMPTHQNKSTSSPSAAQLKVRRAFKQCVECFNIQPYSGGAWPPETGPTNRSYWFQKFASWGLWYYDAFISYNWEKFFLGQVPDYCRPIYIYLYATPGIATTDPTYNFLTTPFDLHAEIWHGSLNDTPYRPWMCVRKKEGTQGWWNDLGKIRRETCCTKIQEEAIPNTWWDGEITLSPKYIFQVQSGLQKDGWDGIMQIENGKGSVLGLTYTDKDNNNISGKQIPFLITAKRGSWTGKGLVMINPSIITELSGTHQDRDGDSGKHLFYSVAWNKAHASWNEDEWVKYNVSTMAYYAHASRDGNPPHNYRVWFDGKKPEIKFNLDIPEPEKITAIVFNILADIVNDPSISVFDGCTLKCTTTGDIATPKENTPCLFGDLYNYIGYPAIAFKFEQKNGYIFEDIKPPPPYAGSHIYQGWLKKELKIVYTKSE